MNLRHYRAQKIQSLKLLPFDNFEAWQRKEFKKKNNKTFFFLKELKYNIVRIDNNCIAYFKEDY
jgi:hypothetical protein